MKRAFLACLLLLASLGAVCAQAAVDIDTAIASAGDKIRSALPAGAKVAVTQFSSDSAELSQYLSSNMESALKQNGFAIIERNADNLKKLNAEIDFQYSGSVSDTLLVEIGKQVGAQYLAYGYFEQLGSYLSLYVRVTNVETAESPVVETVAIRATQKLNELLGTTRELVSATDYIEEIARCRAKLLSIQRERDKETEKAAAAIRAKYQTQINAVNKQEKDPWDSAAEFDARKRKQVADIEKKRDTEIKGESERLSIQYSNQQASVEISEREIKSKLEQQQFKLAGENQVQALLGKFDAESKPKNWPASIKSLDELVPYKASDKLAINDADMRTEYQAIENAKTNGQIAGEITYCIIAHTADSDFDVRVLNYKIYNSGTHAVYLNKSMDTTVRTISATSKIVKTPQATSASAARKKTAAESQKSPAPAAKAANAGTEAKQSTAAPGGRKKWQSNIGFGAGFAVGGISFEGESTPSTDMGFAVSYLGVARNGFCLKFDAQFGTADTSFEGLSADSSSSYLFDIGIGYAFVRPAKATLALTAMFEYDTTDWSFSGEETYSTGYYGETYTSSYSGEYYMTNFGFGADLTATVLFSSHAGLFGSIGLRFLNGSIDGGGDFTGDVVDATRVTFTPKIGLVLTF